MCIRNNIEKNYKVEDNSPPKKELQEITNNSGPKSKAKMPSQKIKKQDILKNLVTQVTILKQENKEKSTQKSKQPETEEKLYQPQTSKKSEQQLKLKATHHPKYYQLYFISQLIESYKSDKETQLNLNCKEHLQQCIQGIIFSSKLKQPTFEELETRKQFIRKGEQRRKTLVFDLDETLIHCNESNHDTQSDVYLPITFPQGEEVSAGINIRPYAVQVLQELSKIYEIFVFTASHSSYANAVIDYLDPKKEYISQRFFREHCIQSEEGIYIKDLRIFGTRSLSDIILIDNATYSFAYQITNGIPIIPFYDDKSDQELKNLMHFLKSISNVKDVRDVIDRLFKLQQYKLFNNPIDLLTTLYADFI